VLGPHAAPSGGTIIRGFFPEAARAWLCVPEKDDRSQGREMRAIDPQGLFEIHLADVPGPAPIPAYHFLVSWDEASAVEVADPYRFSPPEFTEEDDALFASGRHAALYAKLGARPVTRGNTSGVDFGVWAPNAARVSVVGSFNRWDGRRHPLQRMGRSGVWQIFVPEAAPGDFYKFEIKTDQGAVFLKPDPFATCSEPPPHRASIVTDVLRKRWRDTEWRTTGRARQLRERGLHARRVAPGVTAEEAVRLAVAAGCGFVELAPDAARTSDAGLFASAAGFVAPQQMLDWIGACHHQGIGVVLPAPERSLPKESSDLSCFDGSRLFECAGADDTEGLRLDLAKGEVRSIFLSAAAFRLWCWHADALACDEEALTLLAGLPAEHLSGPILLVRDPVWTTDLSAGTLQLICSGRHEDPYVVLGCHSLPAKKNSSTAAQVRRGPVVRTLQPGAEAVHLELPDAPHLVFEMSSVDPAGLFETRLPAVPRSWRFRILGNDGESRVLVDPYSFTEFTFGAQDRHLFAEGNHYRIYEKLGAHSRRVDGVSGVTFAVWAPNAEGVGVVGPFNGWNGLVHQMKRHGNSGVWETFVPGAAEGDVYKFEVRARNGHVFLKSDPFATRTEVPPATASVVHDLEGIHEWRDAHWLEARRNGRPWQEAVAIYEVHLGSWLREAGGRKLSYSEVAARLVPYVKGLGFTHIELLPIAEHPYEPSWGYQVSHFYAPTSRLGRPEELMEFVDICHEAGIGVILDWVAGHFPKDAHALAWFDGTHLFEHADPRKGEHPDWGTLIFNYGRHEVENFLIANALFWLEIYHFDGLRVDAVASMLYLDYSRPAYGGWIPNVHGGKENLEAIEFLKHTNSVLHARYPGILMIAEESTSWPNVSRPTDQGGLGFGFKWNMGWMHDTLAYFSVPPDERKWHHGKLTFSLVYAFNENFVLSLSHDEVVHLKRSLLGKMPGEEWERFANLRLLFALMYAHPGKKLLFMGGELGQESEWSHAGELEWRVLERKPNRALGWYIQDLNRLYRSQPALHEVDFRTAGFEWLEVDNAEESILAFLRKAKDPRRALLFVGNFSGVSRPAHRLGVPYPVVYTVLLNSNDDRYAGSGSSCRGTQVTAEEVFHHGHAFSITLDLPALSAMILQPAPAAGA
jgi:1,4-alpha-glucan branching enzyme